jgi:hypothetical protein
LAANLSVAVWFGAIRQEVSVVYTAIGMPLGWLATDLESVSYIDRKRHVCFTVRLAY